MVTIKRLFTLLIIALLILTTSFGRRGAGQAYRFSHENVLGTSFELKIVAENEARASEAEAAALNEIDRLGKILSTYDEDSELSRWQRTKGEVVSISPELFEVMSLFTKYESLTGGVLNPLAGTAISLWNNAEKTGNLPAADVLEKAIVEMRSPKWELSEDKMTARSLQTGQLAFNTFVKSYIAGKASEAVMDVDGIYGSVVNIGGDIVLAGEISEKIYVSDPADDAENGVPVSVVEISDKAIATSGNYRRGFRVGEEWYSHIIDPRTALPANEIVSATVIADKASDAGAMATAFNILSPEESNAVAAKFPGTEYLIITRSGDRISSRGWEKLQTAPTVTRPAITETPDFVAPSFEVSIEFELLTFAGRSRRPYVAVWLEDEKGETVKTLELWFNNYRWLPDLRRWYTKNYERAQQYDYMQSITSATRSPGRYIVKWDGTDGSGESLKQGKYTVYIEAAREHGTYQLIKQEVELNRKPQSYRLEGGSEIASATIDYRKL